MAEKVKFSDTVIEHEIEEDSELESEDEKRQFNKFDLLDLVTGDDGAPVGEDSDNGCSSDSDNTAEVGQSKHNQKSNVNNKSIPNNKRKPRKKRGKVKGQKNSSPDNVLDDELADLARAIATSDVSTSNQSVVDSRYKLLKVDPRNLIPEAELKRIFGRSVIKDDKPRLKIHPGANVQRSRFVASSYFETKQTGSLSGPRMELDDTINNVRDTIPTNLGGNKSDTPNTILANMYRPIYFKCVHDKPYQDAQRLFLDAVNLGHSEYIVHSLSVNPTHAESLVQLSHMIRVSEDYKTASEFIERALVVFEKGFHPRFNITTATCRLSYKRPENRTFFITIFKHINFCHRRGLRRTPFEYSKLLLSLEPDNDPLLAIQLLDFFAIRCEEFDFLIDFYSKWEQLQKLPNLRFSLALSYFFKSRCTKKSKAENETSLELADKLLKEALLIFPNFIIPLLDACSGEPDAALKQCSYFDYSVYSNKYKLVSETVEVLINLYVKRTFSIWKQKPVLSWLERIVAEMVAAFASGELTDEGKHTQHWSMFPKVTPKNLLRHIVLCDLDITIPSSASSATYIDIDPYPPTDSIVTYDTKTNQPIQSSSANGTVGGGFLSDEVYGLFLRSILPGFSLNPPDQNGAESPLAGRQVNSQNGSPQVPNLARFRAMISARPGSGSVTSTSEVDGVNRQDEESLSTIIQGLQDLHGLPQGEDPTETNSHSIDGNQGPDSSNEQQQNASRRRGNGENDLRRRRQQPR